MDRIRSYKDLRVYQAAIDAAMRIFEITKRFPAEERFSMVDQMRRASRSVCSNIGEAWRKRRYPAHFASKLSDSEGEAEETRVCLELGFRCGYNITRGNGATRFNLRRNPCTTGAHDRSQRTVDNTNYDA
jgi:four helix bundle protein